MIQYYKGGQGLSNRILVLEDEKSVNRGIAFSLEKTGFEAVACGDAKEARAAAAEAVLVIMQLCLSFILSRNIRKESTVERIRYSS